jgi:hypothetical protein
MSMLEAAICPLCSQGWCGRLCLRDPKKQNALLFKPDGTAKTLHERGLAWDDPPLKPVPPAARKKPTMVLLKELAKRDVTKSAGVTENTVTKSPNVTKAMAPVTNSTKRKRGRPAKGEVSASAERMRRLRAKQKPKE